MEKLSAVQKAEIDGMNKFIDEILGMGGIFTASEMDLINWDEFKTSLTGAQRTIENTLTLHPNSAVVSEISKHLYHSLSEICLARSMMVNNIKSNDIGNRDFEANLNEKYKILLMKYIGTDNSESDTIFADLSKATKSQSESDMAEIDSWENEKSREVFKLHGYAAIYQNMERMYQGYLIILNNQQSAGEHPGGAFPEK